METEEDDKDLLSQALSSDPPAEPAPESQQAPPEPEQPEGQPRDEQGRFAAKSEAPPAPAEAAPPAASSEPPTSPENRIPLREHLEERDRRQKAERERDETRQQIAHLTRLLERSQQQPPQPKPPAEAPNLFEAPDQYFDHRIDPLRNEATQRFQQVDQRNEMWSRKFAEKEHGKEAVDTAQAELAKRMSMGDQAAVFEYQRIMSTFDPYGELMDWHRNQTALREIGPDPKAWKEKLQADLLKDNAFLAKAAEAIRAAANGGQSSNGSGRPATTIQLPPSLSKVPAAQSVLADDSEFGDPASELKAALRR